MNSFMCLETLDSLTCYETIVIPGKLLNDDRNQSEGIRSLPANIYESVGFSYLRMGTGRIETLF